MNVISNALRSFIFIVALLAAVVFPPKVHSQVITEAEAYSACQSSLVDFSSAGYTITQGCTEVLSASQFSYCYVGHCSSYGYTVACASPLTWSSDSTFCESSLAPSIDNRGGDPCGCDKVVGDPINAANGNKYDVKTEYQGTGPFPLEFTVAYNGSGSTYNQYAGAPGSPIDNVMGANRIHNYAITVQTYLTGKALVTRPDGNAETFTLSSGTWVAQANNPATLIQTLDISGNPTGWEHHRPDGVVEYFSADGLLAKIVNRAGLAQTLAYSGSPSLLASVTDPNGRSLIFTYDGNHLLTRLDLPDGQHLEFTYDSTLLYLANLTSVKYPDTHTISYLYNESGYATLTTPLTYYNPHALTGVMDENGNRYSSTKFTDGGMGKIANVTYLGSGVDQYTVSYSSGTATITTPLGETDTRTYAPVLGRLLLTGRTRVGSGTTKTASYTYDTQGRPDIFTDFAGTTTDSDYDATTGLLMQTVESKNVSATMRTTQYDWDTTLRVPRERWVYDSSASQPGTLKQHEKWTYNARGQVLTHIEIGANNPSQTRTTTFTYCESADVTAGTCPLVGLLKLVNGTRTDVTDTTAFAYYPSDDSTCASAPTTCPHRKGDLYTVTNAKSQATTYLKYDGAGRPLQVSDINGVITDFAYSSRGWLTQVAVRGIDNASTTDDAITTVDYDPTGTVSKVTEPDGNYLSYTYDTAHRLTDVTDKMARTIHYTLDNAGNRTTEDTKNSSGSLKHTLSRVYDQLGRVAQTLNAAGHITYVGYDANDNATAISDPVHTANQSFDALDRVLSTTQDVGGLAVATGYQYNALDQVTQVTDPKGLATTYAYNGFGELITRVSPDTGTTAYTYNTAHEVATQTDAKGIVTTYGYDALNRLTSLSYPTTALNVTYVYDTLNTACQSGESYPKGHLTQITDASGNTQFCFDRFGNETRKVQVNGSLTQTTRFEYTLAGQLYRVTYPSGAQALYGRNLNDKINNVQLTIGSTTSTLVGNVMYAAFGPISVLTFGNGRLLTSQYDLDYNFSYNFDVAAGGLNLGVLVDDVGNITTLTSTLNGTGTTRNYTYDGLDRLKGATTAGTPSLDETFTYDATGNRLSKQLGTGAAQAYVYPGTSHQLTSIAGGTARTYDADGSTLTEDGGSGILTFVYDDRERMSESKIAGTVYRDYTYNGRGERVSRIDPANSANTVNFVYDEAGHLLGDYTPTGTALHEYVWMDDTLVGVIAPSDGSTAGYEYVETDQIGTPRVVIDPVRNVAIWRWSVTGSTFGDHLPDADADGNGTSWAFNLRFPGQYYEGGYGLPNYNYLRDGYEAATGRYTQPDPLGLRGGISAYGYVSGNPLNSIDPYGLTAVVLPGPTPFPISIPPWLTWTLGQGGAALEATGVALTSTAGIGLTGLGALIYPSPIGALPCELEGNGACLRTYNEEQNDVCPDKGKGQRGIPTNGEPGTWADHPTGKQSRLYGPDGRPTVDIDRGHDHGQGIPHAHNWVDGVRGSGVPVSELPGGG